MNKRGQTLILFIILIPVIIMLMALVVDVGLIVNKKINLEEVTKNVIQEAYNLDDDKIREIFKKNKVDVSNLKITRENNKLRIEIKEEVRSIFGGIVGINKYDIKVDISGYMENEKIKFE